MRSAFRFITGIPICLVLIFSTVIEYVNMGGFVCASAGAFAEPPRSMWVWDVKIASSRDATRRLLDFCRSKNISKVYLTAYAVNEQNTANFRSFNQAAHDGGISVYALGGDPRWGLEKYHQQPLRWVEDILTYNRSAKSAEKFDGIQNDTEIYLLGKFWEQNKEAVLKQYLDLNKKIVDLRAIEEADIAYACDIPFWYDDDPSMVVDWNGETKPPSYHILDVVDSVTIMDYRNFAEGPNGSIVLAKNEVEYAGRIKKKVMIGQETKENLYPEYITFAKNTEAEMEAEIKKVVDAFRDSPGFGGIAMHHYLSYRKLVEKNQ